MHHLKLSTIICIIIISMLIGVALFITIANMFDKGARTAVPISNNQNTNFFIGNNIIVDE